MKIMTAIVAFAIPIGATAQQYDYPRYRSGTGPDYPILGGGGGTSNLTPLTTCPSSVVTTDANSNVVCVPLSQFVTQAVAPGAPGLTAALSGSVVTLTYVPPSLTGGAAITGLTLAQGTSAGGEAAATAITLTTGSLTAGGTYVVPSLAASTAYYWKAYVVNSAGTSAPSAETTATTPTPAPASAYAVAQNTSTENVGTAITYTVTPTGGAWPSTTLTATSTLTGTFAASSVTPTGSTPAVFTYTPSAAGTGTVTIAGTGLTNSTGALSNTVTVAPTGTTYTFAGTAGAVPNGIYSQTNIFGTAGTVTTDGSGSLDLGSTVYSAGSFNSLPIKGDGTYTYNYKASSAPRELFMLVRTSGGGDTYYATYTNTGYTIGRRYATNNVNLVASAGSAPVNSIFVTISGSTITVGHDGIPITSVADSTITADGYFGVGSSSPANHTLISSITTP